MKSIVLAAVLATLLPTLCSAADAPAAPTEARDGMIKVAVVLSEGATVIDFAGPWEVFQDATAQDSHGNSVSPFDLYTVAPGKTPLHTTGSGRHGILVTPEYTFDDAPMPDIVVIGAQSGGPGLSEWLQKVHADHKMIMSVCTGAFKLAKAGLLDGKQATTHHWYFGNFARDFPNVKLVKQVRYVQADPITFSAGGLTSGVDLALHVVAERFGVAQAQKTADYMEYQGTGWKSNQLAAEFPTPVTREEWSGQFAPESALTLHVVTLGASPTLTADIPSQHLAGVPATTKTDNGNFNVALAIAGHPATFEGKAIDENTITGTFTQDDKQRPLTLKKQAPN
ncbi:MAG TPA: DJ-1/PfpI family protein [Rudaea sp.]|jgi:putative intracellular protease/amidase